MVNKRTLRLVSAIRLLVKLVLFITSLGGRRACQDDRSVSARGKVGAGVTYPTPKVCPAPTLPISTNCRGCFTRTLLEEPPTEDACEKLCSLQAREGASVRIKGLNYELQEF